tara:strand:- start:414 stop:572 length:159 start_codon:yes stop_codon:yes gene_type:complete
MLTFAVLSQKAGKVGKYIPGKAGIFIKYHAVLSQKAGKSWGMDNNSQKLILV